MQHPADNNNNAAAPATEEGEAMAFPRAFFTQSDWTGRVCCETWYGKHHPWRRILGYTLVASWAWTFSTICSIYADELFADADLKVPILQGGLSRGALQQIKDTHRHCFQSLCDEIGRGVQVDCVVEEDGVSAYLEVVGENQGDTVFFPEACHEATEATFGFRYLDGDETIGSKPVAFLHLQETEIPANASTTSSSDNDTTRHSLLTLLPDCSVSVNTSPTINPEEMEAIRQTLKIDMAEWEDTINQHFNNNNNKQDPKGDISVAFNLLGLPHDAKQPGHRETYVLKKLFCTDEMSQEVQDGILPHLGTVYNFFIDYRHEVLAICLSLYSYVMSHVTLAWLMVRVLLPAYCMKRFLSWPSSSADDSGTTIIDYWHIWRSLLLLCVISNFHANSLVMTALMTAGACYYRDTKAAMEWTFLGILAWGAPDTVYPYLDSFLEGIGLQIVLDRIDALHILPWIFHLFLVGEGWWKLVTVYVVFRSYQSLQTSLRPTVNSLEQNQLYMNAEQQQQQQQQRAPVNEHVKVD